MTLRQRGRRLERGSDVGIRIPSFAQTLQGRRYLEPFLSGLFSALLAAPCTGPFLGGVLAYTITLSPVAILSVFFTVGLGLAFPYIVLLLRPSLLRRLPRPGAWSVRVRQALSFVLLAAAVFFAQSLLPDYVGQWLWVAWLALLAIWGVMVTLSSNGLPARSVGPVAIIIGAALAYAGGLVVTNTTGGLSWQPMTQATWHQARDSARPILVEYTADWCINCKVLERTVFANETVASAVDDAGMLTLQADLTRPVVWIESHLVAHGGAGLPFSVVLAADGSIIDTFSGMFGANALIDAINQTL